MTFIQRLINVDSALRCIDVNTTLNTSRRHVPAGENADFFVIIFKGRAFRRNISVSGIWILSQMKLHLKEAFLLPEWANAFLREAEFQ